MTDPDKGAAPSPASGPSPARTIPLDPIAAFFRRKADFMEREAMVLALQLREAGQPVPADTAEDDQ